MPDLADTLAELARIAGLQRADQVLAAGLSAAGRHLACDSLLILRLRDGVVDVRIAQGLGPEARLQPLSGGGVAALVAGAAGEDARDARDAPGGALAQLVDQLGLPPGGSAIAAPISVEGQPYGAFLAYRRQPAWKDAERRALARIADVLGLAMLKVRLAFLCWRQEQLLEEADRGRLDEAGGDAPLLERSQASAMRSCVLLARQVAQSDSPVLLSGETGVGKEVLARSIHAWSSRSDSAFVAVNCAALPDGILESELFGHASGAFSGAVGSRLGRFKAADGGTLMLDEVGELSPAAQAALLRVLQEKCFEAVGSDRPVQVDVRIIAATNRDLEAEAAAGRFRRDLLYRLSVFPLHIPPLRSRQQDIIPLAEAWLARRAARTGRGPWSLSPEAMDRLLRHDWPGNIRELLNALERATILQTAGRLPADFFPLGTARARPLPAAAETGISLAEQEIASIRETLRRCRGRIYGKLGAAVALGLKPTTLQSRMRRYGIARTDLDGQGHAPGRPAGGTG